MNVIIGNVIIAIGVGMVFVGMYGFFKFHDFKAKLLVAASIDAMAFLTVLIGAMIRSGLTWFTLKVLLILFIVVILNPVVTSKIALSEKLCEERTAREGNSLQQEVGK